MRSRTDGGTAEPGGADEVDAAHDALHSSGDAEPADAPTDDPVR